MKKTNDALRAQYLDLITALLTGADEEVLRVKSNEIAIPCVDADGEDNFVVITVKVPTGSRDGDPYDGYGEAESYELSCKQKAEKAKADAEKKAKKIARDQAYRAKQAENKAKREGLSLSFFIFLFGAPSKFDFFLNLCNIFIFIFPLLLYHKLKKKSNFGRK